MGLGSAALWLAWPRTASAVGRGWWWRVLRSSADVRNAHVHGEGACAFDTVLGGPEGLSARAKGRKPRLPRISPTRAHKKKPGALDDKVERARYSHEAE